MWVVRSLAGTTETVAAVALLLRSHHGALAMSNVAP